MRLNHYYVLGNKLRKCDCANTDVVKDLCIHRRQEPKLCLIHEYDNDLEKIEI